MGAHPLYAPVCVGYVSLVAHSRKIGIGIGKFDTSETYMRRTGHYNNTANVVSTVHCLFGGVAVHGLLRL